jgi:hypothetical protein
MGAEHKSKVYALHKPGKKKLRLFLGNFCVCYKVSPYLCLADKGKGGRIQSLCFAQTKAAKLS